MEFTDINNKVLERVIDLEKDIACWMFEKIKVEGTLYQKDVVYEIETNYEGRYLYYTRSSVCISRKVLDLFKKMKCAKVDWEWDRSSKSWILR